MATRLVELMAMIRETQRPDLPLGIYHLQDIQEIINVHFTIHDGQEKRYIYLLQRNGFLKRKSKWYFKDTGKIV